MYNLMKNWSAWMDSSTALLLFWNGLSKNLLNFSAPLSKASSYFTNIESKKIMEKSLEENERDYLDLISWDTSLAIKALAASQEEYAKYVRLELNNLTDTFFKGNGDELEEFWAARSKALQKQMIEFPEMVEKIREDYGFHFDNGGYAKIAETDRITLYQVLPNEPNVKVNESGKPVLVAHPYVLGPNILAFLPKDKRSYVHAFANQGVPTYVRIIKDIEANPPVQLMTGEDDVLDTKSFLKKISERHGKPVTLSGVCQGGFILLAGLLSGEYDEYVDAIITNASPIDGTKSKGLKSYLDQVNNRFRDLEYSFKTMPSGNQVVDGEVMSWVYKLKSIGREAPLYLYFRDLASFERNGQMSKTAAAITYWLTEDITDLPVEITRLSTLSYTVPISESGDLPFTLFGRKLNMKRIQDNNIKFLICYGINDELVEPASALAPETYIDVEKTAFPKGHAAIFTSWSDPQSEYALHKIYSNGQRGPVRFHIDLDSEMTGVSDEKSVA